MSDVTEKSAKESHVGSLIELNVVALAVGVAIAYWLAPDSAHFQIVACGAAAALGFIVQAEVSGLLTPYRTIYVSIVAVAVGVGLLMDFSLLPSLFAAVKGMVVSAFIVKLGTGMIKKGDASTDVDQQPTG